VKQIRKRLTYANVMSSIAVFLVLGGATALAASKITAKQLQSNSVTTAKIKKNAVTGSKIKDSAISTSKIAKDAVTGDKVAESTLGQVPSALNAVNATTATTAGTAGSVGGQSATKIFTKLSPGAGETTIATLKGFTITAACPNTGGEEVAIKLHSPSNVPAVMTSLTTGDSSNTVVEEYEAGTNQTINLNNESLGEATFSGATTNGTVVSGNLGFDYPNTFAGEAVCVVYGEAFSG
jgi:hypothetical protein